jgi:hypothetical protein
MNGYSYDDGEDFNQYFEQHTSKNKKTSKRLKQNPSGPYNFKFLFRGIDMDITIENIKIDEFKVTAKSNRTITSDTIEALKYYLSEEGFEEEATKHNLFWCK